LLLQPAARTAAVINNNLIFILMVMILCEIGEVSLM